MSTKLHWPESYRCVILDSVDSTMAEAVRRAADVDAPTWIMARHQTAARGRRGRAWVTPAGNLNATLLFKPQATPMEAALRSFMAANAVYAALSIYLSVEKLALKWPNDVLLSGGKVAGILLESSGQGRFVDWLSIGIGVNLAHMPEGVADAMFPPTSVQAAGGPDVRPEDFLTVLADAYATQEEMLAHFGFPRIRDVWLERAARLGEVITARTAKEDITGHFDTVDMAGNLILQTANGTRAISAAEVYF